MRQVIVVRGSGLRFRVWSGLYRGVWTIPFRFFCFWLHITLYILASNIQKLAQYHYGEMKDLVVLEVFYNLITRLARNAIICSLPV